MGNTIDTRKTLLAAIPTALEHRVLRKVNEGRIRLSQIHQATSEEERASGKNVTEISRVNSAINALVRKGWLHRVTRIETHSTIQIFDPKAKTSERKNSADLKLAYPISQANEVVIRKNLLEHGISIKELLDEVVQIIGSDEIDKDAVKEIIEKLQRLHANTAIRGR